MQKGRPDGHEIRRARSEVRRELRRVTREARMEAASARRRVRRHVRDYRGAKVALAHGKSGTVFVAGIPVVGGDQKRGGLVLGSLFSVLGVSFLLDALSVWSFRSVYIWPLLLIAVGASELMGRTSRQRVERVRSSQLAAAEERVRIARELHDIVAHSVSLMTVQIAAARRVFHKKPDEAEQALANAEETGRQSLAELRSIINVLRGADESIEAASLKAEPDETHDADTKPLPGFAEIEHLVGSIKDAGVDVRLTVAGEAPAAASSTQLAAYRVVQESLTNAMRHAPKSQVLVDVIYGESEVEITVINDAADLDGAQVKGPGHGLVGMKERVEAAGGRMEAQATETGGWRVWAALPI